MWLDLVSACSPSELSRGKTRDRSIVKRRTLNIGPPPPASLVSESTSGNASPSAHGADVVCISLGVYVHDSMVKSIVHPFQIYNTDP